MTKLSSVNYLVTTQHFFHFIVNAFQKRFISLSRGLVGADAV